MNAFLLALVLAPFAAGAAHWQNGLPADPNYFPIAVWLQEPRNAEKFKAAGINLYVALWEGPTEAQLAMLAAAGMPVICAQNETGLKHKSDKIIVGWMHGDEPDNAQELPGRNGYGPPIPPAKIIADYEKIRAADPTRPVMLNLGQGVAWDQYSGRGVRTNHPEDYPEYIRGGDIISFDIYPIVHDHPAVAGKLWYVPQGVARLKKWSPAGKIVWNCIECTRIGNPKVKPAPAQVRTEVWMSLIHGSCGLIYFVHQFKPKFIEAGLLADPDMLAAVTAINHQIHELAPVLNSPTVATLALDGPLDAVVKNYGGATYVFAVAMRPAAMHGTFHVSTAGTTAEALGENRTLAVRNGVFTDAFQPYEVHLYRIR